MNTHRYKITVEALTGAKGEPVERRTLSFETANHDDILGIVDRMRSRLPFDEDTIASLGVGLKLFSEVVMMQRHDPMFAMNSSCIERVYTRTEAKIDRAGSGEPRQIALDKTEEKPPLTFFG